jgi:predicted enzyme related to lactoylglutathione lyase
MGGKESAVAKHLLVLLVLALAWNLPTGAQTVERSNARDAHGIFTGEVKPVLYVTDVEVSANFFRDVLGFGFRGFANRSDGEPYYADMTAGKLKFGLHEPIAPAHEARVGKQRLYFRVKDLSAHWTRVAAWGGDPGDIKDTDWMDMFTVRDPDGHEIVFAYTDPGRHSIDPW